MLRRIARHRLFDGFHVIPCRIEGRSDTRVDRLGDVLPAGFEPAVQGELYDLGALTLLVQPHFKITPVMVRVILNPLIHDFVPFAQKKFTMHKI